MTVTLIDEIIEHLSDGEWHTLIDIDVKTKAQTSKILLAVEFLAENHLIDVLKDEEGMITQLRLTEPVRRWYVNMKEIEDIERT